MFIENLLLTFLRTLPSGALDRFSPSPLPPKDKDTNQPPADPLPLLGGGGATPSLIHLPLHNSPLSRNVARLSPDQIWVSGVETVMRMHPSDDSLWTQISTKTLDSLFLSSSSTDLQSLYRVGHKSVDKYAFEETLNSLLYKRMLVLAYQEETQLLFQFIQILKLVCEHRDGGFTSGKHFLQTNRT